MQRERCISGDQYTQPFYTEQWKGQGWDYTLSRLAENM